MGAPGLPIHVYLPGNIASINGNTRYGCCRNFANLFSVVAAGVTGKRLYCLDVIQRVIPKRCNIAVFYRSINELPLNVNIK